MQTQTDEKTVIIYSSARKVGNTAAQVEQYLKQNNASVVYLDDYAIVPYRYDKQYPQDDFYSLFESLLTYQHWVFASPIYWYNTTTQMKTFMDRITDYMDDEALKPKLRTLRSKQFSLLSNAVSETAPNAFVDMFKHTFTYLGMTFNSHQHMQAS